MASLCSRITHRVVSFLHCAPLLVIMIRILRLLLRPDHGDKAPIPLARAEPGSFRAAAEKGRYYAPDYRTRRNTVLRELSRAAS
jgi:hypothetical protein